jgi:hypothetical protein
VWPHLFSLPDSCPERETHCVGLLFSAAPRGTTALAPIRAQALLISRPVPESRPSAAVPSCPTIVVGPHPGLQLTFPSPRSSLFEVVTLAPGCRNMLSLCCFNPPASLLLAPVGYSFAPPPSAARFWLCALALVLMAHSAFSPLLRRHRHALMSASNVKVSCAVLLYHTSQRLSSSRSLNTAFTLPRFGRWTCCFLLPRANIIRALTAPGYLPLFDTRGVRDCLRSSYLQRTSPSLTANLLPPSLNLVSFY